MPSTPFAGHASAPGAKHAHANSGVGMPPGERKHPLQLTPYGHRYFTLAAGPLQLL